MHAFNSFSLYKLKKNGFFYVLVVLIDGLGITTTGGGRHGLGESLGTSTSTWEHLVWMDKQCTMFLNDISIVSCSLHFF